MKKINLAIFASLALIYGSIANAGVIFEDNFDTVSGSGNAVGNSLLNWDGGDNWQTTNGTVDLVHNVNPWGIECLGNQGYCVDLDGSTGNAAEFISINVGPLSEGDYSLSFWLSGNQRGGGDFTVSAILADGWLQLNSLAISLAANAPWQQYTLDFSLSGVTNPVNIVFHNFGGDNVGMILDDVKLVPAPATLALFGLGLVGIGLIRRRRS